MSGLDTLLAKSLDYTIKENFGKTQLVQVEKRLLEKYGISLIQSLEDFTKLDDILREFFGEKTNSLERQYLGHIINMQDLQVQPDWLSIEDNSLARLILEVLGDEDKKNIIDSVLDEPRIISEILEITKISQTSGYRKVNSLIDAGLLIVHGTFTTPDRKVVNKYKSIFENVKIDFAKNKVVVKVQLTKESLRQSSIIKTIGGIPDSLAIASKHNTPKGLIPPR
jgi:hypothetical protein